MSNEKIKLPKMEWETEKKFPGAVFLISFFRKPLGTCTRIRRPRNQIDVPIIRN